MDVYVDEFRANGGSMVMLAKGNRSKDVTDACAKHGGFYLGSIGGPAAVLAKENIKSVEVVDFEELGMDTVRKIEVVDFLHSSLLTIKEMISSQILPTSSM